MKPILLEMQAFGPYADLQEIDFRKLKDINMFLIHGNTGGGKTTILDAICYALYGDTSGAERDAESMRSHFASEDVLTQVKLTFEIKGYTYFIDRIPAQERPKKSGTGFTMQAPEVELYIVNDEEKELLASGINRTKEKVIELIGFDASQFRQVIMIPQGQFRQLLVAESEERQQILGEIFQTRKYKKAEDKIREQERKLKDEVASIKERCKEQVKNIKYREGTLLEQLIQKDNVDLVQVIDGVVQLCKIQQDELIQLQKESIACDTLMKEMSKTITIAIQNQNKHNEKIKIQQQYKELLTEEQVYSEKQKQYTLAQRALPLRKVEQYIETLNNQKTKVENDIIVASRQLQEIEKKHATALLQMEEWKNKEPEMKQLEMKMSKALEEYIPKVESLTTLQKERKQMQQQIEDIAKKEKQLQEQKVQLEKDITQAEQLLEQRQKLNDQLREYELKEAQLTLLLSQKNTLLQLEKEQQKLRTQYKQALAEKKKYDLRYVEASQVHNDLVQSWAKGQAAILAKKLQPNEKCPVCGSTTHPELAKAESEIPSQQQIDEKKGELDIAHVQLQQAQNQLVRIETEGKAITNQVEAQKQLLGEYAKASLDEIQKNCDDMIANKNQAQQRLQYLAQLEKKLVTQKKDKLIVEENIIQVQQQNAKHTELQISLHTNIEQIEKEIPISLRSKKALDDYISNIQTTVTEMRNKYNQAQKTLEETATQKIEVQTLQKEKNVQLQEVNGQYEAECKSFNEQITEAGFSNVEQYKEAYRAPAELTILDEQIKQYYKQKNGLEAQYQQLVEETKDIVLVNIEQLEKQYKELEVKKEEFSREHQTIMIEKEHNENQVNIILRSQKQMQQKEKEYSIVGDLYRVVRGSNVRGLSFERFIQSSLFEDILIRANERLQRMSNNRYELYRSDKRKTMASQAGLEMEVLDTYTGKKRHVRTLSGGEGFMASLSLALGLADVVQSYAGGITLDTMFIDEGFGTLDSESLDLAIHTLIDLQQSGRLVGIISHVPELKERIGARLEVVTTQKGSRAIFHL